MKRVSKTLRNQNYATYEHNGFIVDIYACLDPNVYHCPGYYFGTSTNLRELNFGKNFASLQSAKNHFQRIADKTKAAKNGGR